MGAAEGPADKGVASELAGHVAGTSHLVRCANFTGQHGTSLCPLHLIIRVQPGGSEATSACPYGH